MGRGRGRPERRDLARFEGATVDDLVGPGLRLLFVGINPGLWTAATNTHFAYPGNRFYPALAAAGIAHPFEDPAAGLTTGDRRHLIERGVGITNVVARATARASQLTPDEIQTGGEALAKRIRDWQPPVVAVLGITVYRTAFGRRRARCGEQPDPIEGSRVFVFGNPSGLNAHETIESLAASFATAADAAGIERYS
jgi:TDG/mug DNA glycosylase family protein